MRTLKKNASFKFMKNVKNFFIIAALLILAARYYFANDVKAYSDGYIVPTIIVAVCIIIAQLTYDYYVNHVLLSQLSFKNWHEKHIFMTCINDLQFDKNYLVHNLAKKNITKRSEVQHYLRNYEYYMKLQNIL